MRRSGPDERCDGGKKQILTQMANHYSALVHMKPTYNTRPTEGKRPTTARPPLPKLDKKRVQELLAKDPNYREQRETMTRASRAKSEVSARLSREQINA